MIRVWSPKVKRVQSWIEKNHKINLDHRGFVFIFDGQDWNPIATRL